MTPVRTSLAHSPSTYTPEQLAASLADYERELFERYRVVVVRLREPRGLARFVIMALEAWAIGRFGKGRKAA